MPKKDYFGNVGGLNLTDSPFYVSDNQATSGWNFDLLVTGAFKKSRDRAKINTVANSELKTIGLHTLKTTDGTSYLIRGAGTKLQSVDLDTPSFTNLTEDTLAVNSDFLSSTSTQPLVASGFNTATANAIWAAGAGATTILGILPTKVTQNGVATPTGTFTLANLGSGTGGAFTTIGDYYYALALRKTSTQALSNAGLDQTVTIATVTDTVQLTFPTGVDATKYDKWYVYRSAVSGVTGFTAGTLVAQVTVGTATYTDVGNVAVATSQVVPRPGNTTDNSVLPSGAYNTITTFKRRLVTAQGSTFYLSDLNKPESWPTPNAITIPTGGNITGLAVVGFNSPVAQVADEYLVIFKETEMYVFTGSDVTDWELKFVDRVGSINQSLIVNVNGYLCWIDYRGVYMWNGNGKPVYCSRPIEANFGYDGDLDKTKLNYGFGTYYRKQNQVVWTLSHKIRGENKYQLKMDLRLTSPKASEGLDKVVVEGVFCQGYLADSMYASTSYFTTTKDELFIMGDDAGYVYKHFYGYTANGAGIDFQYDTRFLDMGMPAIAKRFKKVVVWIDESASKDLTLQYWADYRSQDSEASQIALTMAPKVATASLWDLAVWDVSDWDSFSPKLKGITYNLSSAQNNAEGDSLKLRFLQQDADAPVTIHGFTVFYEELSVRH